MNNMVFQKSELFLTTMIVLFFLLSIVFLFLLVISRIRKLRRLKKQKTYDFLADYFLFSIIFEDKSYAELAVEKEYISIINDVFFKKCLLDAVIKLHKNYTGEIAKKIESFYTDSSLIRESYKKLKHGSWSIKCEAVRELAEMNITSSYSFITEYVSSKNLTLRQESITAIIKLIGLKGLIFLNDYDELLTDWIQLNLLSIIKKNFPTTDEPYYNTFIESKNASVAVFGKRLKLLYENSNDSPQEIHPSFQSNYIINTEEKNPIVFYVKRFFQRIKHKSISAIVLAYKSTLAYSIILFFCYLFSHTFEIVINKVPLHSGVVFYGLLNDAYTVLLFSIAMIPLLFFSGIIRPKLLAISSFLLYLTFVLMHLGLSIYFSKANVPLGSDLLAYSRSEIMETSKAAGGLTYNLFFLLLITLTLFCLLSYYANRTSGYFIKMRRIILPLTIVIFIFCIITRRAHWNTIGEFENYIAENKSFFFIEEIAKKYTDENEFPFSDDKHYYLTSGVDKEENYINPEYPFLKKNSSKNTLAAFFRPLLKEEKPNLVFILLEGMGSDFLGNRAKLGNFNPFLDSLSNQSLFWENALSAGGRTFAALPSIFASLPFLEQGYLEAGTDAPKTNSLFKILACNGYRNNYYTGSNASFDKMDVFLKAQGVKIGSDLHTFGKSFTMLPSYAGFSWGYGDKDIFKNYFNLPENTQPYVSVFFTVANHSPYLIPNQEAYVERAKKRIEELQLPLDKKDFLRSYVNELSCMLYADDALKYFMNEYSKRPGFENTIFIITGDHRAPEIPISFQIDRFRVPLVIFSRLLKRKKHFKSVVTHLDITPSLLALLSNVTKQPSVNSWVGTLLDTTEMVLFNRQVALMRNKNEFQDYLSRNYFLSGSNLYMVTDDLGLNPVDDEHKLAQLKELFNLYKSKNRELISTKKLIPDSAILCQPPGL